jgi:hypothetical protein
MAPDVIGAISRFDPDDECMGIYGFLHVACPKLGAR